MPEKNFLLQKDIKEKLTEEIEERLKKLVEEQQNILRSNKICCEEYHTTAIDPFKLEISRKLDLLINKVSKIERFLEQIFDSHILFNDEFKKI